MSEITLDELKKRRKESMFISEQAVLEFPDRYKELKRLIRSVVYEIIDISDYYKTARSVSDALKPLAFNRPGSIFHYFYEHIDPGMYGDVRYLRAVCTDCLFEINAFDRWRTENRNIHIVRENERNFNRL